MFVFMSVVLTVSRSVGMFVVFKDSVFYPWSVAVSFV